jgi:hypothetical protein
MAACNAIQESGIKVGPTAADNAATAALNKPPILAPIKTKEILKLHSAARASGDSNWKRRRGEG